MELFKQKKKPRRRSAIAGDNPSGNIYNTLFYIPPPNM